MKKYLGDFEFISDVNDAFAFGAYTKGYAEFGWQRTGVPTKTAFGALLRHAIKWFIGEDVDNESGLSHTAHIGCNASFMHTYRNHQALDNRPHKKKEVLRDGAKKNESTKIKLEDIRWDLLWRIANEPDGIDKLNHHLTLLSNNKSEEVSNE